MLSKHQPSLPSGAQAAFAFHSGKTRESLQSLPNGKSLTMNNQQLNRSTDSPKEKENSVKKIHQLPSRCCSCDMNSASKDCTVSAWRCMNSCCSVNSLCIDRKFCVASFQTTWNPRNMHSSSMMWISKIIHFVRLSHDTIAHELLWNWYHRLCLEMRSWLASRKDSIPRKRTIWCPAWLAAN